MMVAPSAFAIHEDDIAEVLSAIGIDFAGYVRSRVSLDVATLEGDAGDSDTTTFGGTAKGQIDFSATSDMGAMTASAKVSLVMDAGGASSDDAWVALSNDSMEFKLGRFEAEGLFGLGQDFYVPEAPGTPDAYETNKARGRTQTGAAVTMNPSDTMMVQVGAVYGNDGDNFVGIRPLVKIESGAMMVKAGGEYYMETPTDNDAESQTTWMGFGGNAEFGMGAMTLGAAIGYGINGGKNDAGDDLDDVTYITGAGYLKMSVGENGTLGAGVKYQSQDNEEGDDPDPGIRTYVSYEAKPFMNDNMRWEVGGGYAMAMDGDSTQIGVATRLRYDF
jgi:hypothetical protein